MTWATKIDEWGRWASERLRGPKEIPSPRYWLRDAPWFDDFLNLLGEDGPPRDLRDAFEAALQREDSFAARFVGLDLYHRLAHQDSFPLTDELVKDARRLASEEYRWLVAVVPAAGVPADRRRFDWELRVSSELRMWDRADALLDRLTEIPIDVREAHSVRAEHLFLRRYSVGANESHDDAAFDDYIWHSRALNQTKSIEFAIVFIAAVAVDRPVPESAVPSPETIYAAVEMGDWPQVPWLRSLMLARPAFELGLYSDVIKQLTKVLDEAPSGVSRALVYEALSHAHERQGSSRDREDFLQRWSFEFPEDHQVLIKLAHVAADSANYEKAYQFLERAVALKPELEQDLPTRISLALGRVAVSQAATWAEVRAAVAQNPEVVQVVEQTVRAYWAGFAELEQNEQVEWITALYAVHLLAPRMVTHAAAWLRSAGVVFLTVAECQLRGRVFEMMRTDLRSDPVLLELARSIGKNDSDYIFACYLKNPKGAITLGQMYRVLNDGRSKRFAGPLGGLLSKHVGKSPILTHIDALKRLDLPRNDAVHKLTPVDDAKALHDDARIVIDAAIRHAHAG